MRRSSLNFPYPQKKIGSFVQLLKYHAAFHQNGLRQKKCYSTELHLLVLLKYMDSKGNACTAIAVKEGLGLRKGSVRNYLLRAVNAVSSLFKDTVFWPNEEEHKEIRYHFHEKYYFPYCVGAIDGTHLGLAFKSELDGEDYWTRKQSNTISATIICDMKKIQYLNVGWPGSVHDKRVFQNSVISKTQTDFFLLKST